MRPAIFSLLAAIALGFSLSAQSPAPVVLQAASPAPAAKSTASTEPDPAISSALKMLQQMKAANEETLKKQAATLQQLDVIEKEANEIRIYTKRT